MKKLIKNTALAAAIALTPAVASAEGELVIYHWFEYIPK